MNMPKELLDFKNEPNTTKLSQIILLFTEMGVFTNEQLNISGVIEFLTSNNDDVTLFNYAKYLSAYKGNFSKAIDILKKIDNNSIPVRDTLNFTYLFSGDIEKIKYRDTDYWADELIKGYKSLIESLSSTNENNLKIDSLTFFENCKNLLIAEYGIESDFAKSFIGHINLYEGILYYRYGDMESARNQFIESKKSNHINCNLFSKIGIALASNTNLSLDEENLLADKIKKLFRPFRYPEIVVLLANYVIKFSDKVSKNLVNLLFKKQKYDGIVFNLYSHYLKYFEKNKTPYLSGILSTLMTQRANYLALINDENSNQYLISSIDKSATPLVRFKDNEINKPSSFLLNFIKKEKFNFLAFIKVLPPNNEYIIFEYLSEDISKRVDKYSINTILKQDVLKTQKVKNKLLLLGDYSTISLLKNGNNSDILFLSNLERGCISLKHLFSSKSSGKIYLFISNVSGGLGFNKENIISNIKKSSPNTQVEIIDGELPQNIKIVPYSTAIFAGHGNSGNIIDFGTKKYNLGNFKNKNGKLLGCKVLMLVCSAGVHGTPNYRGTFNSVVTDFLNMGASLITASFDNINTDDFGSVIEQYFKRDSFNIPLLKNGWINFI